MIKLFNQITNPDTLNKSQQGFYLEQKINQILDLTFLKSYNIELLTEKEIVSQYGSIFVGIDHLIFTNDNKFIATQCKYRDEKFNRESAGYLFSSVHILERKLNIKCKAILIIIKSDITNRAKWFLEYTDYEHYIIKNNNIEQLARESTSKIYQLCNIQHTPNIITPRPHQLIALSKWNMQNGIVCHPTGTGKSILEMMFISKYLKNSDKNLILFITQYAEVARSIFENDNIQKFKNSRHFPPDIEVITWMDKHRASKQQDVKHITKTKSPVILCCLASSFIKYHQDLPLNKFGLVIYDECHHIGDNEISGILKNIKNNCCIVGFSATPIRTDNKNNDLFDIFKNENNQLNYIDIMLFFDAVRLGLCTTFTITFNKNKNIIELLDNSYKSIIRVSGITKVDRLYEEFKDFKDIKFFTSHSRNDGKGNEIKKFKNIKSKSSLIVSHKCREGFDCPEIDTIVNMNPSKNKGIISIIQEIGRGTRINEGKEKCFIHNLFTDDNKMNMNEKIVNYISNLIDYIGIDFANKEQLYINIDKDLRITSGDGNVENDVNIIFPEDFTDYEQIKGEFKKRFVHNLTYKKAKKIIKQRNIKTTSDAKQCVYLPTQPEVFFGYEFISWFDYLGIDSSIYLSCFELEQHIKKRKNELTKINVYDKELCIKQLIEIGFNIPSDIELVNSMYCRKNENDFDIFMLLKKYASKKK